MAKNYLFAPFRDDDDKIEEFNAVVNALKYVLADVNPSLTDADRNHYMESALHGLRVFIGRLESYYDVIISDLKERVKERYSFKYVEELKAENKRLKAELQAVNDVVKDLQAEAIEQIKDNKRLQDKLQEVNNDYNNDHKVHNEYADGLLAEIKELKAENESLYNERERAVNDYESLLNSNSVK